MTTYHFSLCRWLKSSVALMALIALAASCSSSGGGSSSTPKVVGPAAPSQIEIVERTSDSVTLEWDLVEGVDSYKVYLAGKETACEPMTEGVGAGKYRCRVSGLASCEDYAVTVSSVDENAKEGEKSTVELTASTGTSPGRLCLREMREHTALSAGSASYDGSVVTFSLESPALEAPMEIDYPGVDLRVERDGDFDGSFDGAADILVDDTDKLELDAGEKIITLKSDLEAGLYRLSYTTPARANARESRYIDIAPTLYVDDEPSGSGNGDSWANAYNGATELQALLDAAAIAAESSSIPIIAQMKSGVYKPTALEGTDPTDAEREKSFSLKNKLRIYGGYSGSETKYAPAVGGTLAALTGSDAEALTIFSGDLKGDDTPPTRDDGGALVFANISDNSNYVFLSERGEGSSDQETSSLLSGVKITGAAGAGAGMSNANFSPTLGDIVFSANSTTNNGGAMYNKGFSSPRIYSFSFRDNSADGAGGAMYNARGVKLSLVGGEFVGNFSKSNGGALANYRGVFTLTDVVFKDNSSAASGGAMDGNGARLVLTNVMFSGNSSSGVDGGGGAMRSLGAPGDEFESVVFSDNHSAGAGGAVYSSTTPGSSSTMALKNVEFNGNTAGASGGALYASSANTERSSTVTLSDVKFNDNSSDGNGGAMYSAAIVDSDSGIVDTFSTVRLTDVEFKGNTAKNDGGAAYSDKSIVELSDGSFSGNSAMNGGALFVLDPKLSSLTDVEFSENKATGEGDAQGGGALYLTVNGYPLPNDIKLSKVVFRKNSSTGDGGAIFMEKKALPAFADVGFIANSATRVGGAIAFKDVKSEFVNALFALNSAEVGGAVSLEEASSTMFTSATFINNEGADKGASASIDAASSVIFVNSILWSDSLDKDGLIDTNRDGGIQNDNSDAGSLRVFNSIALDNPAAETLEFDGNGNVIKTGDGADLFVDLGDYDGADNEWLTADDGIRIKSVATEAVNMGLYARRFGEISLLSEDNVTWVTLPADPTEESETGISNLPDGTRNPLATDILGNARIARPDIGAYEAALPLQ